jgi:hypothetical protein
MLVINLGGDEIPWTSPWIPGILIGATISAAFFVRHERRFPMPVLPLGLVKTRHMVSQVGLNLFGAMTVFGVSLLVTPLIHTYSSQALTRADVIRHPSLLRVRPPHFGFRRLAPPALPNSDRPARIHLHRLILASPQGQGVRGSASRHTGAPRRDHLHVRSHVRKRRGKERVVVHRALDLGPYGDGHTLHLFAARHPQ